MANPVEVAAGSLREKLLSETSTVPWVELQRLFAAGQVIAADPALDLLDVACALARDDTAAFAAWTEAGQVGPVRDEQAASWHARQAHLWCVVIKPWVLVQDREAAH